MDERNEPSVWYVAGVAICLFVGVMMLSGMFTGTEGVAIAAQ